VGLSLSFQVAIYYAISRLRIEQLGSSFGVVFLLFLMKAGGFILMVRVAGGIHQLATPVPWPLALSVSPGTLYSCMLKCSVESAFALVGVKGH